MEKQDLQNLVGNFCSNYRAEHLKLTLNELSEDTGVKYKTLYSFERGLSSNLYIFYLYYNRSKNKTQFVEELRGVVENG